MKIRTNRLLGYDVSSLTMMETLQYVNYSIKNQLINQITVINANKVYLADKIPKLKQIIQQSQLVIPEQAFVIAGYILGRPLRERVSGIELMEKILEVASSKKYKIFLLGGTQDVVSRLSELCGRKYNAKIVGFSSGYFDDESETHILNSIRKSKPDILFVALGSPKQELWIHKFKHKLNVSISVGVGGSFDHIVGDKKQAPKWMRFGLEWVYRSIKDPRLWTRYATINPYFLVKILESRFFSDL